MEYQKKERDYEQQQIAERQRKHDEMITGRLDSVAGLLFMDAELEDLPQGLVKKFNDLDIIMGEALYLDGPTGCGKSHALRAFAKHFIRKEIWPVTILNWEEFLVKLKACYGKEPGKADQLLRYIAEVEILGIDDLMITGTRESDFSLKTMYVILNTRIEARRPTFFASNRPVEDLLYTFDARILSRVRGCTESIHLTGKDRRLGGK